jgi:hypothetical protein
MKLDWNAFMRDAFACQREGRAATPEDIAKAAELHLGVDPDELLRETREAMQKIEGRKG